MGNRAARAIRRFRNPYRLHRREGRSRMEAFRWALMTRRSGLGDKGWVPRKLWLSLDPKAGHHYSPSIKKWVWRGRTLWTDGRAIARQSVAAAERFRNPPPVPDGVKVVRPTNADVARANQHLRDLGWT